MAGRAGNPPSCPPRRSRCPTLVELATEAIVANIDMCAMASRELWSRLPRVILVDIYERLSAQHRLTLEAWSLLSTTVFSKGEEVARSIIHNTARVFPPPVGGPLDPDAFTLRFGPAWSPDTSFITHLTLDTTCELDSPHLLLLPAMPNLGLLRIVEPRDLSAPRARVTDRVVRGWAELSDPFPALRVLQLSCCTELTPEILRYLGSFPALVYVAVRALRSKWGPRGAYGAAPKHGWRPPRLPHDVRALMSRYFASCLGSRHEFRGRWEVAAKLISEGRPAGLSRLFDGASTVRFKGRPAVLPWDGMGPSCAENMEGAGERWGAESEEDVEDTGDMEASNELPLGDTITVYDNPAWWLYAAIGHVILRDGDLKATSVADGVVPTSNGLALPPLPVLSLTMAADEPRDTTGYESRRGNYGVPGQDVGRRRDRLVKYVFVRESAFNAVTSQETAWVARASPPREKQDTGGRTGPARVGTGEAPLRQRKRRKMGDLLSDIAGS